MPTNTSPAIKGNIVWLVSPAHKFLAAVRPMYTFNSNDELTDFTGLEGSSGDGAQNRVTHGA